MSHRFEFAGRLRVFLIVLGMSLLISDLAMAGADSFVRLRQSYRFEARSGIAKFSKEVNRGDSQAALKILADENLPDIIWEEMVGSKQWEAMLATRILEEFAKYLKADSVSEAWAVFDQFQILLESTGCNIRLLWIFVMIFVIGKIN